MKHITVYHKMSKISLTPSFSSYKLEVDGQEIAMVKNKLVLVKSKDLKSTFSVYLSADNQVILDTPSARVTCTDKSPYASALSYRVKSEQCSLSQEQQQLIQSEEEQCTKYKIKKTPVSSLFKSMKQSSYSVKKHSAIYQGEKICISQKPVVQCVSGSTPKAVTNKIVKFVCLPEGRISKLYAERSERGESPQELRQQPVAFETKMAQPISCGTVEL